MQTLGLISGQKEVEVAPENTLEDILPELLASLSDSKKVWGGVLHFLLNYSLNFSKTFC